MWDELRLQLGPEFAYFPGSWFRVPEKEIFPAKGKPIDDPVEDDLVSKRRFEEKRRPVVLVTSHGPNSRVLSRSASVETRFSHYKHAHEGPPLRCCLPKDGWINYEVPVNLPISLLGEATYYCPEPDSPWLISELRRAGAL